MSIICERLLGTPRGRRLDTVLSGAVYTRVSYLGGRSVVAEEGRDTSDKSVFGGPFHIKSGRKLWTCLLV